MKIFRFFAFGLVFVGLVAGGTGCSQNAEKLAYLKEKYKLMKAEADAKLAAQNPPVPTPQPAPAPAPETTNTQTTTTP
jgi:hypothetical protein